MLTQDWSTGSSLRICEGHILSRILENLSDLEDEGQTVTHKTFCYTKCFFSTDRKSAVFKSSNEQVYVSPCTHLFESALGKWLYAWMNWEVASPDTHTHVHTRTHSLNSLQREDINSEDIRISFVTFAVKETPDGGSPTEDLQPPNEATIGLTEETQDDVNAAQTTETISSALPRKSILQSLDEKAVQSFNTHEFGTTPLSDDGVGGIQA